MMMDDHWYILELLKKHKRFDVRIMYNTNMARLDWKGKKRNRLLEVMGSR